MKGYEMNGFGESFRIGGLAARCKRSALIAAVSLTALAACSSPEQRLERYYASGERFLEAGELGKANVEFQNALKIDETHLPTLIGLSKVADQRQDFKAMFALMQTINRLDPQNVEAIVNIGKFYLLGSDETGALEQADKALAIAPEDVDALALKAAVLLRVGDRETAVEYARKVTAIAPTNSEAVTVIATERLLAEEPEQALAEVDKALAIDERVAILQLLRINILSSLERSDEVAAGFENLIRIFPEESAYRRGYTRELFQRGDMEGALEQLNGVLALEPDNLDIKIDIVRLMNKIQSSDVARAKLVSFVEASPENTDLKFALADFDLQNGDPAAARTIISEIAKSDDEGISLRAKNRLAALHLADGEQDAAVVLIDEILEVDERNTEALLKRAGLRIDGGELDEAIVDLRAALDNNPEYAPAMVLMATAFEKKGDLEFAESQYARAVSAEEGAAKAANLFAQFLLRREKRDRAEDVLVKSLATEPGNMENLKLLAAVRLGNQDWRGAQEVANIIDDVSDTDAVADSIRTVSYSGLGEYDVLIDSLTNRDDQAPLESRPLATLVDAYMKTERMDEAEELLRRIVDNDNSAYFERLLLAQVLGAQQKTDEGETVLLAAVNADPDRGEAYELLYRHYLRTGAADKATTLIDDGLTRSPDNQALRIFKADIHLSRNELEEAFSLYEALAEERPNDKIVVNNFVSLATTLREDAAVLARAREAAKILEGDDNPFFKDTLGWAMYRTGDTSGALPLLQEAALAQDSNAEILYHLGAVYAANNDLENARKNLEKAIEVGGVSFPYREEAQELLDRG